MRNIVKVLFTFVMITALLLGCAPAPTQPPQPASPTDAPASSQAPAASATPAEEVKVPETPAQYQESPMLAELVKAGKLPPVEERLPVNPLVVNEDILAQTGTTKDWTPGVYGGTLRVLHNEPNNAPDVFFIVFQQLIRPPSIISGQPPVNNIVEFMEVDESKKEYTFKIREGLKWSDGVPVTTEDIRFTYEDVLTDERINPTPPVWASQNGKIFKLEVMDDFTFKAVFEEPNGRFLRTLAIENWPDYSQILKPKHYLQQFHIEYTPLADMKALLDQEGFGEDWTKLFLLKDAFQRNITGRTAVGMPVLNPWVIVSVSEDTFTYERNPYYFKVDEDGKQLPYIDRIVSPKVQDGEMENMKVIVGEADVLRRNAALMKLPLYKENEEKGGYTTLILNYHLFSPVTLYLNMTYADPSYRETVGDIRFRKAVSMGIDNQEIIDSVYLQQGSIPALMPAGFDPDEANKLLDEMGMEVGSNGFRTAPDGKPFSMLIEISGAAVDQVPTAELISSHLKNNLMLDVSFKKIDNTLYTQRNGANEIQATIFWAFDAMADDEASTRWMNFAAPLWASWKNSKGESGEEPPDWAKEGIALEQKRYSLIYGSPEYYEHKKVEAQYYYDNVPAIHPVEGPKIPLILSNKLANGPVAGYQIAGLMMIEGMYFKE